MSASWYPGQTSPSWYVPIYVDEFGNETLTPTATPRAMAVGTNPANVMDALLPSPQGFIGPLLPGTSFFSQPLNFSPSTPMPDLFPTITSQAPVLPMGPGYAPPGFEPKLHVDQPSFLDNAQGVFGSLLSPLTKPAFGLFPAITSFGATLPFAAGGGFTTALLIMMLMNSGSREDE